MKPVTFPIDRPEQSLGFQFWQATNLWQRQISTSLKKTNLTHVQFVLLAGIGWLTRSTQEVTQTLLASHANTDIMMTSKVVRTLVQKQLILRDNHPTDTRAKIVFLTAKGQATLQEALRIVDQVDRDFFQPLGDRYPDFAQGLTQLIHHHSEA